MNDSESGPVIATKERLARKLDAHNLTDMAARARNGYYDDFESELATPIAQPVYELKRAGHRDFAARVTNGEFDATQTEADAWAASPEGREIFGSFEKC